MRVSFENVVHHTTRNMLKTRYIPKIIFFQSHSVNKPSGLLDTRSLLMPVVFKYKKKVLRAKTFLPN